MRHLKLLCTSLLLALLSSCSGGGGSGNSIDLSLYLWPSTTTVFDWNSYDCDSIACPSPSYSNTQKEEYQVSGNEIDYYLEDVLRSETLITSKDIQQYDVVFEETSSFSRFMPLNKDIDDDPDSDVRILGPFSEFSITAAGVTFTEQDVLIIIWRDKWSETESDVGLTYFAKGKGAFVHLEFSECPVDVEISETTDYETLCAGSIIYVSTTIPI